MWGLGDPGRTCWVDDNIVLKVFQNINKTIREVGRKPMHHSSQGEMYVCFSFPYEKSTNETATLFSTGNTIAYGLINIGVELKKVFSLQCIDYLSTLSDTRRY